MVKTDMGHMWYKRPCPLPRAWPQASRPNPDPKRTPRTPHSSPNLISRCVPTGRAVEPQHADLSLTTPGRMPVKMARTVVYRGASCFTPKRLSATKVPLARWWDVRKPILGREIHRHRRRHPFIRIRLTARSSPRTNLSLICLIFRASGGPSQRNRSRGILPEAPPNKSFNIGRGQDREVSRGLL